MNFETSDSTNDRKDEKIEQTFLNMSTLWKPFTTPHKSAFLPYRQQHGGNITVLTNLQRGNTQTPAAKHFSVEEINFHTRAGHGEIALNELPLELEEQEDESVDNKEKTLNTKSIDCLDDNGLTALHWAAAYGQYNTVEVLILRGGSSVDQTGPNGETSLLLAAANGHHEVVRLLVNEGGADVNLSDHFSNTALMYAAKGNHVHCCQELLIHSADLSLTNLNGDTALSIAITNNSVLGNF